MTSVSFKVYFTNENGGSEVRRFGIENDVVTNFSYLLEKLKFVFPSLKNTSSSDILVHWKDAEGDNVRISSDGELIIALTESNSSEHNIVKLHVSKNSAATEENTIVIDMGGPFPSTDPKLHVGVVCDGCEGPVKGFRYKCMICRDFDLCQTCESKSLHPEHQMLRIPTSGSYIPRGCRRNFFKQMKSEFVSANHIAHHTGSQKHNTCKMTSGQSQGNSTQTVPLFEQIHSSGLDKLVGDLGGILFETFAKGMGEISKTIASQDVNGTSASPESSATNATPVDNSSAKPATGVDVKVEKPETEEMKKEAKNVLEARLKQFESFLVEQKQAEKEAELKKTEKEAEREAQKPVARSQEKEIQIQLVPEQESLQQQKEAPEEEWTFVDEQRRSESPKPASSTGAIPKRSATASSSLSTSASSSSSSSVQGADGQKNDSKLDVRVQESLARLLAIGFTNEGGWLTELLNHNDGNLSAVLEQLIPYK